MMIPRCPSRAWRLIRAALLSILLGLPAGPGLHVLALGGPKVIPMPAPPGGPAIRRVTHDALGPVTAGARVTVTVLAEPGATITARLGRGSDPSPCSPSAGEGAYTCSLTVPEGLAGGHHVLVTATDRDGGSSTLSSTLPVRIDAAAGEEAVNALNARLRPVFFRPESSDLDDEARAVLEADLELLQGREAYSIRVEGHCDPAETKDPEKLSRKRAEAVAKLLVSLGLERGRLSVAALGATEPIVRGPDEQESGLNRRVMILLAPPAEPSGK